MLSVPRSRLRRYGVAVASIVAALLLSLLLHALIGATSWIMFIAAVAFNIWYGGLRAGLLTTGLSTFAYTYSLLAPVNSLGLNTSSAVQLGEFVLAALLISWLYEARRRAAEAAYQQSQKFEATISSIGDAVITTDQQGSVTLMNRVAEALTGWNQTEALGKDIKDVFVVVNQESRQEVRRPITEVLRGNRTVGLGNHPILITKDGKEVPIDDSSAPIRDENGTIIGVILVFRDVAERRQKETALDATLQRTQDLYETCRRIGLVSSPDEVVQALLASRYLNHATQCAVLMFNTLWNDIRPESFEVAASFRADRSLPGFDVDGAFGSSRLVHLLSRDHPVFIEDAQSDTRIDQEARALFVPTGTRSMMLFPLAAGHRCFGLLLLYFPSPQHWSQEDYRHIQVFVDQVCVTMDNVRLFEAEARARLDAEEANEIKLKFLAMISHELRTPLTSIKGFATTLLATDVTWSVDSQQDFISIINEEADKLTELIDQLLDLSRLQAGQLRIQPESRSLDEIMDTAIAQLEALTAGYRLVINQWCGSIRAKILQ